MRSDGFRQGNAGSQGRHGGRLITVIGLINFGPHLIKRQAEDLGHRRDSREGWGGYAARLDLSEGFWRHTRRESGPEHRALAPDSTQQRTKTLSTLDLCGCERQPDHGPKF
jgi:hypothetical protein